MADGNSNGNNDPENGNGIVDGNDRGNLSGPDSSAGTDPLKFDKRGRGRPPLSDEERAERAASRGGKGGSGGAEAPKTSGAKRAQLDVGLFAQQIIGVHKLLALATKNEVWIINETEAKNLAVSIQDVLSHHKINVSPATVAYIKLLMVAAAVYGPRIALIQMMAKEKQAQEKQI